MIIGRFRPLYRSLSQPAWKASRSTLGSALAFSLAFTLGSLYYTKSGPPIDGGPDFFLLAFSACFILEGEVDAYVDLRVGVQGEALLG